MNKHILHQNEDGTIAVTTMAPEYVADMKAAGFSEEDILDLEAKKVVPETATRLPNHLTEELPDFNMQEAWHFDETDQKVKVHPEKEAKVLLNRVRATRDQLLDESDKSVKSHAAKEKAGKENKLAELEAYQQALRDLPETITDPKEVVWPVKPI